MTGSGPGNAVPVPLSLAGVSLSLRARRILDDISFSMARAEAIGLVGVNGAGKTTLIRSMLDLTRIDSGSIAIGGVPHRAPAARRHCTYLAERFVPPPFATGAELLAHLLALHRCTFDRAQAEAEARALDLDPIALDAPAREYSKGMAQKLGLIACLLPAPMVLVLDEPMSGLDPKARALFKRRLGEVRQQGSAVFFSTHLLADVETVCDRILVLDGGRLRFDGSPARLLERTGTTNLEAAFLHHLETSDEQAGRRGAR